MTRTPLRWAQTGSHDLIVGTEQSFTGYVQLLAGCENTASASYATASAGLTPLRSGLPMRRSPEVSTTPPRATMEASQVAARTSPGTATRSTRPASAILGG